MSQQQTFGGSGGGPGTSGIETVTGNTGGAVSGTGSPVNLNLIGDTGQGVHVNGDSGTSTETITIDNMTTTQKGVTTLATNAEAIAGTDTAKAITSDDLKAKLGAQTSHGLAYGAGTTSPVAWLAEATNGQIPIGSTGNPPVLGLITSSGGTISWTFGAGTINAEVVKPTWTTITASTQNAAVNNGYITNNATGVTITLPATAAIGDVVHVMGLNAGGWVIAPNAGQTIKLGNSTTSTSIASTAQYDNVRVRCIVANTTWSCEPPQGNITVN